MLSAFKTFAIVLLFGLSATGCVPALLTIEPSAEFLVVDTDGNPIEGANINFATTRGPFGPRTVAIYVTDSKGRLKVRKKRKWHTIVFLPDGSASYEWNFCVEKSGYIPFVPEHTEFGRPILVALERSVIAANCRWPTNSPFYPAEVVWEGS